MTVVIETEDASGFVVQAQYRLSVGDTFEGTLEVPEGDRIDIDKILLDLKKGESYQMLFESEGEVDIHSLRIYSFWNEIRLIDDVGAVLTSYTPPSGGKYYLSVSGGSASSDPIPYTFSLMPEPVEVEDADAGVDTEAEIVLGLTMLGTLPAGDVSDWYSIQLEAGESYRLGATARGLDPSLALYDDEGTLIRWDENGGTGKSAEMIATVDQSGTYFLGVSRDDGEEDGTYRLFASEFSLEATSFVQGTHGGDIIIGEDTGNKINLRRGADYFEGGSGDDEILGSLGRDTLRGGAGKDSLIGAQGADLLLGGKGRDVVAGHSGNDTLYGGAQNDSIFAGSGRDVLFGGRGADKFYVRLGDDTTIIRDFEAEVDSLIFASAVTNLGPSEFVAANAEVIDGDTIFTWGEGDKLILRNVDDLEAVAASIF